MILRTVYANEDGYIWDLRGRQSEWEEVDKLVFTYQKGARPEATEEEKREGDEASTALINRFQPLFKKYLLVIKLGKINFNNAEQKNFVRLFLPETSLKYALSHKKVARSYQERISERFNFIVEGYGKQEEEEILADLRMLLLIIAKRYKDMGKSFACYVYNSYRYEVARRIMAFNKNPANFHYKNLALDDTDPPMSFDDYDKVDDTLGEDEFGIPDASWIKGEACSDLFAGFAPVERLIFSKYYLQSWNDGQIGQLLGMHANTINQQRKSILKKLCDKMGRSMDEVKRYRHPGADIPKFMN